VTSSNPAPGRRPSVGQRRERSRTICGPSGGSQFCPGVASTACPPRAFETGYRLALLWALALPRAQSPPAPFKKQPPPGSRKFGTVSLLLTRKTAPTAEPIRESIKKFVNRTHIFRVCFAVCRWLRRLSMASPFVDGFAVCRWPRRLSMASPFVDGLAVCRCYFLVGIDKALVLLPPSSWCCGYR
jgi:hypothetical protein